MKIRSDFVTNSSSSSFVIAFKKFNELEITKEMLEQYPSLKFYQDLLAKVLGTKIASMGDFKDYVKENYGINSENYETDEEFEEKLENYSDIGNVLQYLNKGYAVFIRDVSYEDDMNDMSNLLHSFSSGSDIIVEDSGY